MRGRGIRSPSPAVTGEARWVMVAGNLLDTALDRFGDGSGGFYDTADDAERLLYRPQDPADNATPSGWFAAAGALLSYGALTGSQRHTDAALAALLLLSPRWPGDSRGRQAGGSRSPRRTCPARSRSPSWASRAIRGRPRAAPAAAAAAPPGAVIAAGAA